MSKETPRYDEAYEKSIKDIQENYIETSFENPNFEVLSTIRFDPKLSSVPPLIASDITKENFFLFDEHYHRLIFTLRYFQLQINGRPQLDFELLYDLLLSKLIETIEASNRHVFEPMKVRLLVTITGDVSIELHDTPYKDNLLDGLSDMLDADWDVYIDKSYTLPSPFTSFKTTNRKTYNESRARSLPGNRVGKEEVLLYNSQLNIMEGSITNIAVKQGNQWITPQLSCGCLCGVMRHFLLRKNYIKEQTIPLLSISVGSEILLFNGIMGVVKGTIVG